MLALGCEMMPSVFAWQVWQGQLVAGAALAGSELAIGSIACSIVGSDPPAGALQHREHAVDRRPVFVDQV